MNLLHYYDNSRIEVVGEGEGEEGEVQLPSRSTKDQMTQLKS